MEISATSNTKLYFIADAALLSTTLKEVLEKASYGKCLFKEENSHLSGVAPYLLALNRDSDLFNWIKTDELLRKSGIFVSTYMDFEACWLHFRQLLSVLDESGRPLLFRYYDPRILHIFLETIEADQVAEFFNDDCKFVYFREGEWIEVISNGTEVQKNTLIEGQVNEKI